MADESSAGVQGITDLITTRGSSTSTSRVKQIMDHAGLLADGHRHRPRVRKGAAEAARKRHFGPHARGFVEGAPRCPVNAAGARPRSIRGPRAAEIVAQVRPPRNATSSSVRGGTTSSATVRVTASPPALDAGSTSRSEVPSTRVLVAASRAGRGLCPRTLGGPDPT